VESHRVTRKLRFAIRGLSRLVKAFFVSAGTLA
jgi:hypothetical protein